MSGKGEQFDEEDKLVGGAVKEFIMQKVKPVYDSYCADADNHPPPEDSDHSGVSHWPALIDPAGTQPWAPINPDQVRRARDGLPIYDEWLNKQDYGLGY